MEKIYSDYAVDVKKERGKKLYLFLKRAFDLIFSSIAIIALLPIMIIIGILIKVDSKGPAVYVQKRIGKDGKEFNMYKFRSMCADAHDKLDEVKHLDTREDGIATKIKDDPRVTKVGKILRKVCADELPQLFNVFLSQMTIVGPRPPLPEEVAKYNKHHMERLTVKPGLTCYWQVSDRKMDFNGWVDLDVKYIRERNLWVDIKLIFKTFTVIFKSKGDN